MPQTGDGYGPDVGGTGGNIHDIPEDWLPIIVQHVTGLGNMSARDFSAPMIKPAMQNYYVIFVVQYLVLAILAVAGNLAMLVYIVRYKLYRDVTHAFLSNLAVAHLVQICMVMPMTVMVIIIQNWIYGQFMCYFTPLLQDIPMHVAMLTHMLIACDRMRWLPNPTRGRLPSFVCCCATWLTGMIIALPFPIYTTYLDMGRYFSKFRGVGICMVNLIDDINTYMRVLFFILYVTPAVLLVYLNVRTSNELQEPDMAAVLTASTFENLHRTSASGGHNNNIESSAANNKRTRTTSKTPSATRTGTQKNCVRSFDVYDAELDRTRERRTLIFLATMAAVHVLCLCPLMLMKLARMELVETYENSFIFDISYLIFVWIAFMPACINPLVYAAWVMSAPTKQRLRHIFRMSAQSCDQPKHPVHEPEISTTTTTTTTVLQLNDAPHHSASLRSDTKSLQMTECSSTCRSMKSSASGKQHRSSLDSIHGSSQSSSLFGLLHPKPHKHPPTRFSRSTEVRPGDVELKRSRPVDADPSPNGDSDSRSVGATDESVSPSDTVIERSNVRRSAEHRPNASLAGMSKDHPEPDRRRNSGSIGADPDRIERCSRRGSTYSIDPLLTSCSDLALTSSPMDNPQPKPHRLSLSGSAGYPHSSSKRTRLNSATYSTNRSTNTPVLSKVPQIDPLIDLLDIEADDEYTASRCTSVSTYTNELEMDALERRRSLVSPAHYHEMDVSGKAALPPLSGRPIGVGRQHSYTGSATGSLSGGTRHSLAISTGRRLPAIGGRSSHHHHPHHHASNSAEALLKATPVKSSRPILSSTSSTDSRSSAPLSPYFPNQVFTHHVPNHRVSMVAAAVAAQSRPVARTTMRSTSLPYPDPVIGAPMLLGTEERLEALIAEDEFGERLRSRTSSLVGGVMPDRTLSLGAVPSLPVNPAVVNGVRRQLRANSTSSSPGSTSSFGEYRLRDFQANI